MNRRIPPLRSFAGSAPRAGWVHSFVLPGGAATSLRTWDVGHVGQVLSYGLDTAGELYLLPSNGNV